MDYIHKLKILEKWLHMQIDDMHSTYTNLRIFEETGYLVSFKQFHRFDTFEEYYAWIKSSLDIIENKNLAGELIFP